MTLHEPEEATEAPERWCPGCDETWPDDDEFFDDGSDVCIACAAERVERRRQSVREAARRYRARQRETTTWT